jgi:glycerol-3-phosphate acyltransferase PlsY
VAGHNYSVWLGGKGGRGLATALGAIFPIAPLFGLIWMVLWAAGYAVFREVNVGSAVACVATLLLLVAAPFPSLRPMLMAPATAGDLSLFACAIFAVLLSKLVPPVVAWARRSGKG